MKPMGFSVVKQVVIEALLSGDYGHEVRGDIEIKNLLSTGVVTAAAVVDIIKRSRGGTSSFTFWSRRRCLSVFISDLRIMRFFIENEKGRALCQPCGGLVATTFKRRDVPFSDAKGAAQNILVGVCDQCDQVVVIPAQSTPAIRDARHKSVKPIEASLPAIYLDVLDLAAFTVDNRASTDFRRYLLSYFVHKTAQQEEQLERVVERYEMAIRLFPEKRGVARRRLSLKVPQAVSDDLRLLCESSHLNTSNVIKSVVFDIQSQIIESPKQPLLKELRSFAAVLG